jgi:uncharacterized membrane protein
MLTRRAKLLECMPVDDMMGGGHIMVIVTSIMLAVVNVLIVIVATEGKQRHGKEKHVKNFQILSALIRE